MVIKSLDTRRGMRGLATQGRNKTLMMMIMMMITDYNLHPRAHGFTLPEKDNYNFIPRILFERIYC